MVRGKKASPQELIGKTIVAFDHKIHRGKRGHEIHMTTSNCNYVFFEPITCCNTTVVDYFDSPERLIGQEIVSIDFDNGKYSFQLTDDVWQMTWLNHQFKPIPLLKLSRQELK